MYLVCDANYFYPFFHSGWRFKFWIKQEREKRKTEKFKEKMYEILAK